MGLHPNFPVVQGAYRLTRDWELELPGEFSRRLEEGDLVLWRPRLTFWIAVWGKDGDRTTEDTLTWIQSGASPERTDEKVVRSSGSIRLTYRLHEEDPDRIPSRYVSISGFVIEPSGHVQISAYCDDAAAERLAERVIASVRCLLVPD